MHVNARPEKLAQKPIDLRQMVGLQEAVRNAFLGIICLLSPRSKRLENTKFVRFASWILPNEAREYSLCEWAELLVALALLFCQRKE